ncbi:hypothetical protein, variant [Aphanomyces invadans]|uniref:Pop1 N-terminal domain-containing protein n=1 Tax=Aphanomyces invadans TaxID=157072 RepID=A0A024U459_9STRA|nr:hypothetical protein, variant [Aphanomyces invadans]ETW01206.1 hypothetical protein, variant [Aphanomyces invadans]|eukprot:XP_008870204.1 hypothetical protein, variant [Aphanomyces invadans]
MDVIEVVPFAAARVHELHELHVGSGYEHLSKTRIARRRKDFHLRRRANAYKSHKFPARFRVKPNATRLDADVQRCRKHRRRHMLREKPDRLPTHQWHAKRMKMGKVDDVWIALHRLDRGTAAALLAPSTVCDTSYLSVVDVHGLKDSVVDALDSILDESLSEQVVNGGVEATCMVYHADMFPMEAIGPAHVMCKNSDNSADEHLHVWLWVYPSMIEPLLDTLASIDAPNVHVQRRTDLSRFEIRGPKGHVIMNKVLQNHDKLLWTAAPVPSSAVIQSWHFLDPRQSLRKNKATTPGLLDAPPTSLPDTVAECPISNTKFLSAEPPLTDLNARFASVLRWASDLGAGYRHHVGIPSRRPASATRHQRADANTSTTSILWDRTAMPPPFLPDHIVNQPARESDVLPSFPSITVRCAHGWDIVVHSKIAPTLLKALVFAGASAIGLAEREALRTRHHLLNYPRDYPDTHAGCRYWGSIKATKEAAEAAKPKAKRTAFQAMQVASPFAPDWSQLFSDVSTPFCVLRGAEYMRPFPFYNPSSKQELAMVPTAVPTLICVQVTLPRRGTVDCNAMMCFPTESDVAEFERNDRWQGEVELTSKQATKAAHPNSTYEMRSVMGFVTSVAHVRGSQQAVGFCHSDALQHLFLQQQKSIHVGLIMVRNPTSRQYRPALVTACAE